MHCQPWPCQRLSGEAVEAAGGVQRPWLGRRWPGALVARLICDSRPYSLRLAAPARPSTQCSTPSTRLLPCACRAPRPSRMVSPKSCAGPERLHIGRHWNVSLTDILSSVPSPSYSKPQSVLCCMRLFFHSPSVLPIPIKDVPVGTSCGLGPLSSATAG
jgi:hypothetical protein